MTRRSAPSGASGAPARAPAPEPAAASGAAALEARVEALLAAHAALVDRLAAREGDLARARREIERRGRERAELRARVDALLVEVDAAVAAATHRG